MATIIHKYSKKLMRNLGPSLSIRIGSNTHILRAFKPETAAKAIARIQKKVDPVFAEIRRNKRQSILTSGK